MHNYKARVIYLPCRQEMECCQFPEVPQHMVLPRFSSLQSKHNPESTCSVTESCPVLCNPTDCSTASCSALHYLPEFAQSHVHWMNEATQPSHSLLPPSPPALNLSHTILQKNQSKLFDLPDTLDLESVHLITKSWHPFTNLSLFLHLSGPGNHCSKLLSVLRRVFLSWWLRW